MNENLLHFIWKYKLLNTSIPFVTQDGQEIIIVHNGFYNTNEGPDFLEAKIKIGNMLWNGSIEIHVKSSDWNKHQHIKNKHYNNTILHIVYEHDEEIKNYDCNQIPTFVIKNYLLSNILNNYEKLIKQSLFIPCANSITQVKEITLHEQLDRMLIERLEEKSNYIENILTESNQNWSYVFYRVLARAFGLHINQDVFENVAQTISLNIIAKHKNNPLQIESLLFGQAGFLNNYFDEAYPIQLQKEYHYLQKLYNLKPLHHQDWKFLRLRPANFPTIRVAQFAQLLIQSSHLFSKIVDAKTVKDLETFFNIEPNEFWQTHYTFSEVSEKKNKNLGRDFIHLLLINAVIPTLFMYGKLQAKEEYCVKAIAFLKKLKPEKNAILKQWKQYSVSFENAYDTQALLHLTKNYCNQKRCLECSIGYSILKK